MVSLPIVLLIFISSNNPQEKTEGGLLETTTPLPERGFADSGKSTKEYQGRVNDLTTSSFKFPEERRGKAPTEKKIIREKVVPEEENDKTKSAVPLYSLVKNECGEGYALDENGVCQKTIALRSGKKLGSEKRRKRQADNSPFLSKGKSFLELFRSKRFADGIPPGISSDCGNLYPGLVSDGAGGCIKILDEILSP